MIQVRVSIKMDKEGQGGGVHTKTPTLGKPRQDCHTFETTLVYIASSRPVSLKLQDPVSKKKKKERKR